MIKNEQLFYTIDSVRYSNNFSDLGEKGMVWIQQSLLGNCWLKTRKLPSQEGGY